MNFASTKSAYDRLPAMNVNDIQIKTYQDKQKSKVKKEQTTMDIEPNLEDYLRPSEVLEYKVELDDDDDENVPPKKYSEEVFRNLHEMYEEYFDKNGPKTPSLF